MVDHLRPLAIPLGGSMDDAFADGRLDDLHGGRWTVGGAVENVLEGRS